MSADNPKSSQTDFERLLGGAGFGRYSMDATAYYIECWVVNRMAESGVIDAKPRMVQADYDAYPSQVLALRPRCSVYPRTVSIETQVKCNAKCDFCPYPKSPRQGEEMPTDVFEKIIDDLSVMPKDHWFQMALCRINEPLLDSRLEGFHDLIARKLPGAVMTFWSNGTMLREGAFEWMGGHKGARLVISLNAVNEADHVRLMGFGLKRVLKNLDYVHRLKADGKFDVAVSLVAPWESKLQAQEVADFCRQRWPLFSASIRPFFEWVGQSRKGGDYRQKTTEKNQASDAALGFACAQWFDLHILANGYATKCCIDETGFVGDERFNCATRNALEVFAESQWLRDDLPDRSGVSGCEGCRHLG